MMPPAMDREFRELPCSLLIRPELDARTARDPDKLADLASDIARRGVIFPLAVVRVDDRYEVVDGFRRFLAAQQAGLAAVPCLVYPTKTAALEGIKYAANVFREDMSPAEEALFFFELFQHECGEDLDQVCALMNRKRSYVEGRIALLQGDPDVFEALRQRRIAIGVAQELNRIPKADYRGYYLGLAIRDGASVSLVAGWVTDWFKLYGDRPPVEPMPPADPSVIVPAAHDPLTCYICRQRDPRYVPELVSIHTHCRLAVLDQLLTAYHGGA